MEKLDLTTPNFTDENIQKISELFPNCVTEDSNGKSIDFDALKQELSSNIVEGNKERYQLTWPGKAESLVTANTPINKTLRPSREESKDFDNTENLYIEGDNLEVLKLLQETYLGKVKMIYIDPPYNTGNDFVYKDNFTQDKAEYDEESGNVDDEGGRLISNPDSNGRYHSDWLSMMYPRLKLARNLLKDDGVIFISIDDNEVHNLRKVCDEVFGSDNFLNLIILENDSRARPYGSVATTHEYILAYAKKSEFIYETLFDQDKAFDYYDQDGGFDLYELRNRNAAFNIGNRPNLYYSFWVDPNSKNENDLYAISLDKKDGWIEVYPQESQGVKTVWRWGKEKASANLNTYVFAKEGNTDSGYRIVKKYRENTYSISTVWNDADIKTDRGTLETKALFDNKKYFDFPKPKDLIRRLLTVSSGSKDIALDFFSGSGTTAHAVMQLNAEDGGNRKFIMAQIPEATNEKSEAFKAGYKTIAEIGKERIRRAGEKIKEDNADKEGISDLDIGFRVLKVDSSNIKDVYFSPDNTSQDDMFELASNIKDDRTDEDLLFMVLLDWGIDLSVKIERREVAGKTVYFADDNFLAACFEENLDENFVKALVVQQPLKVVLRDSGFASSSVKINVEQIFKQADIEVKVI